MKEAVKEGTVKKKKIPEVFINGKDTVSVSHVDEFKRLPQVGQKRLRQRKGTNLSLPQWGQPYMAPPKE